MKKITLICKEEFYYFPLLIKFEKGSKIELTNFRPETFQNDKVILYSGKHNNNVMFFSNEDLLKDFFIRKEYKNG